MSELKGFDYTIWAGLFAPAATPTPIVEKLKSALREAYQSENIQHSSVPAARLFQRPGWIFGARNVSWMQRSASTVESFLG